jgi:hypothetical protein
MGNISFHTCSSALSGVLLAGQIIHNFLDRRKYFLGGASPTMDSVQDSVVLVVVHERLGECQILLHTLFDNFPVVVFPPPIREPFQ